MAPPQTRISTLAEKMMENDGDGLYYYRNRYYSPNLQRFPSEDPMEMLGSGPNLYA
jgi:RHS repeat-associated protein